MTVIRTEFGVDYDTKKRLASYWHQVDECRKIGGRSVLFIGQGSGLAPVMLGRAGFQVTVLDNQKHLTPKVIGDVRHLPFADHVFDISVCCQVLEHLSRDFFIISLRELRRVSRKGIVLSLPDSAKFSTSLSRILQRKEILTIPSLRQSLHKTETEHSWEVNLPGHDLANVQSDIDKSELRTLKTFRVWENPYHRFWRLAV